MTPETTEKTAFYRKWLVLLALVWLLPGIFCGRLESGDGTRVAGIAAEMALGNEWIVPRLNGTPFLEYPPLYYLWTGLWFRVFGICEEAALLASILAALGTVALVWKTVLRAGGSPRTALTAGFILTTSAQFWQECTRVRVDILLVFFVALALYGFVHWTGERKSGRESVQGFLWLSLGVAGGVLTKGLVGAVLPAAGIGGFCLADDILSRKIRFRRYMLVFAAFLTGLLPAVFWGWCLWRAEGDRALYTAAVVNNFGRFRGTQGDHASPIYEYLLRFEIFQPYLLLVPAGLVLLAKRLRRNGERTALLWICCLLFPYGVLTLSSAKRIVYLLSLAPVSAVIAAECWEWLRERYAVLDRLFSGKGERRILLTLLAAGLAAQAILAAVWQVRARDNTVADFWREADGISRKEERKIVLYRPLERTAGAAVFYLRRTAETRSAAQPGREKELWIFRMRKSPLFQPSDRHAMFRFPEEFETWKNLDSR